MGGLFQAGVMACVPVGSQLGRRRFCDCRSLNRSLDSLASTCKPVTSQAVSKASHAGFSPQDIADEAKVMLDGVRPVQPAVVNDRPYAVRVS